MAEHEKAPERRLAQRALADELTALVHGREAADAAAEAAGVLFGADPLSASAEAFAVVRREVGVTTVPADALGDVIGLLARTPLAGSNGDARRTLAQRGYRVNGQVLDESTTSAGRPAPHRRPLPGAAQGQDQLPRGGMWRRRLTLVGPACRVISRP